MTEQLKRIEEKLDRLLALIESGVPQAHGLSPALPTFGGYNCSWTVDREGFPSYIIDPATGEMAHRHSKQDDIWWSIKDDTAAAGYRRILGFTAVELAAGLPDAVRFRLPDEAGPLMSDEAEARERAREAAADRLDTPVDEDNPFDDADESRLREMHQLGRQVYGDQWHKHGRALILAESDGRTETSAQLTTAEAERIISLLRQGLTGPRA